MRDFVKKRLGYDATWLQVLAGNVVPVHDDHRLGFAQLARCEGGCHGALLARQQAEIVRLPIRRRDFVPSLAFDYGKVY